MPIVPPLSESLTRAGIEPRILVVRLSALGDIVFATSLLQGLRNRWPRAYIAWVAQAGFAGLLDGDPRLDRVIRAPAELWSSIGAMHLLGRELRAQRFDWVIDAQGLAKSRWIARLAGPATRIGFDSREPLRVLMHRLIDKGGEIRDIASEYRYLAQRVTGEAAPPPRLPVGIAKSGSVAAMLKNQGATEPFIALCPFTTRPQKHWMEDYWPRLAQLLVRAGAGPCAVLGGPGDRDAATRLVSDMPAGTLNLVGKTAVPELAATIKSARLVIGVDTGLTHIGVATQRPTLALFGSTCPYLQGAESPLIVMYDDLPCAPCKRRPSCGGAFTCMRQLTPERVAAAALRLLGDAA